jgi:peptidoglycan hydrolase-like protein with peptidoglycan-binding domain
VNEHARRELEMDPRALPLVRGDFGHHVSQVQEHLCLAGFHTAVDGDFGPATEAALKEFQWSADAAPPAVDGKPMDFGCVSDRWWRALVAPLWSVADLERMRWPARSDGDVVAGFARGHLLSRPREVGKPNGGPWVRYYCRGQEVPWCAGFATTVLSQSLGHDEWFTLSCDDLASRAMMKGRFRRWEDGVDGIRPGNLFVIRRDYNDWIHCGIVTVVGDGYFETIEGNTNTAGAREGTAVHTRTRAFGPTVDFVLTGGDR